MIFAFMVCLFAVVFEAGERVAAGSEPVAAVERTPGEPEAEASAPPDGLEADVSVAKPAKEKERAVKITSVRTDYDRREGVVMFDRDVFVDDPEYKLHADRVYVFLDGTNELKRIVAIGNVAVTNGLRSGTCAKATYSRANSRLVMYGDNRTGTPARLEDNGKKRSELVGRKITFWTDTEQVEVEGSQITVDAGGKDGAGAAKKLFGK